MIKNIIFSGGGFKGWAYIGTIKALNEYVEYSGIEQVIGVSIGSLFGLLYVLKFDPDFILDFVINLNFKEIIDIDIDSMLINQSLLSGIKFTEIVKELISFKIDPDITFNDLKKYSKILFTVNAINISDSKLEYFNYSLTPNVKVIDAVRASCSLPLLFPSYHINGKYYFDGGFCNNCPVDLVDEINSIAFDLTTDSDSLSGSSKLYDFLNSLMNISNELFTKAKTDIIYRVIDNRFKNEMVNLNQSKDDIFNIYMSGYKNTLNILFKNERALPWISEKN
jgi:NTE family protein